MGSQMWRPEPVDFHSVARIRKLPAGPINALECDQWSRLTTLMPARPWNAPTEPPDGHTSSLASNHVRHRPHLQARRAHRAQGLGTRPIRIIPEPRHRPARVPGNARSGVGLEHRCQTPARLATARGRAARRTRRGRERRGRTAGHLEGFGILPRVSVVGIRPDRPGARAPSIDPSASDIYPHLIRGKLQIPSCKHSLTPAHTRSPE